MANTDHPGRHYQALRGVLPNLSQTRLWFIGRPAREHRQAHSRSVHHCRRPECQTSSLGQQSRQWKRHHLEEGHYTILSPDSPLGRVGPECMLPTRSHFAADCLPGLSSDHFPVLTATWSIGINSPVVITTEQTGNGSSRSSIPTSTTRHFSELRSTSTCRYAPSNRRFLWPGRSLYEQLVRQYPNH